MKSCLLLPLFLLMVFLVASCSPSPKSVAEQDALDEAKRLVKLGEGRRVLERYLAYAMERKYVSVAYFLLGEGVPVPENGLRNSCADVEMLKLLREYGADDKDDALILSARIGYAESVKYLVGIGAVKIDEALKEASAELRYLGDGKTSPERYSKYLEIAEFLMQKGARPSANTIGWAIRKDDIALFKKLLKYNINLNTAYDSPLFEAIKSKGKHRKEFIQLLLEYPQDFSWETYREALRFNEFNVVRKLLQKYDKDKNLDPDGLRAITLESAVKNRQTDLVRILIQKNFNIAEYYDSQDLIGITIKNKDPEMLELLLAAGCALRYKSYEADKKLINAIRTNDPKIVTLLLNAGIQFTPGELTAAVQNGNRKIIGLLLAYHFTPAKIRNDNYLKQELTKAMYASAEKNDVWAVHLFLTSGADIFQRSERKKVPLYTFVSEQNKACRKLLSDANLIYETAAAYLQALRNRDEDAARKMFVEGDFDAKGKYKYYFWREQGILVQKKYYYERIQNILQLDSCKLSDDIAKMYIQQTFARSLPKIQWFVLLKKINNVWYVSNIADLSVTESENKKIEQLVQNVPERPTALEIIGVPGPGNDGLLVHDLILEFNKIIINDHPISKINSELQKSKSSFTAVYTARLSNGTYIFTRHAYRNGFPKVSFHPILLPKDKKEKLINEFVRFKVWESEILPPHARRLYQKANAHYQKGEIGEAVKILSKHSIFSYPQVKWLLGYIYYRQKGYESHGWKLCNEAWNEVQYLPVKK